MKLKDLLLEKNFPNPSSLSPAAQRCLSKVLNKFGQDKFEYIWGRVAKNIDGTDVASQHTYGNALDFMVFSDKELGDAVNNFLLKNRENLDIRNLIWYQKIWNSSTDFTGKPYTGKHSHKDHVHVDFISVEDQAKESYINKKNNTFLVNLIMSYYKISSTKQGAEEYFSEFRSWNPFAPGIGDNEEGAADKLTSRFEKLYEPELNRIENSTSTSKEDKENVQYIRQIVTTLSNAILNGKDSKFDLIYNKYNKDTKQYERKMKSFNWNYM